MEDREVYRHAVIINGKVYPPIMKVCLTCGYAHDDNGPLQCGGMEDIEVDEDDSCPSWDFGECYPEDCD